MTKAISKSLGAYAILSVGAGMAAGPPHPTFAARRDYTYPIPPAVYIADLNRDGIPDLVGPDEGNFYTWLGNGNGTFRPGPTSPGPYSTNNSIPVDLNGDGNTDLVSGGYPTPLGSAGIAVSFGSRDGTFQSPVAYPAGTDYPVGLVVLGDFNGDGILDAALPGSSGIWLFAGQGGGIFSSGVLVVPMKDIYNGTLVAADFNDDGSLDLAVTSLTGYAVILGNGDGTFQAPKVFTTPSAPFGIAAAALVPGGNQDIVIATGSSYVLVYFGNGKGGFSAPRRVSLPAASGITIGDVNGDGIPDLVDGGVYIAYGNGEGGFSKPVYNAVVPGGAILGDLRNNGRTDIVTDSGGAISVLLNTGRGKFEDGDWIPITGGTVCGAAADFNRDGKPDLAVNTAAGVSVLLGTSNPKSPFITGTPIALAGAACLLTGDLNGDGIPDLLVPANNPNGLYAYLGKGDGTFSLKSFTATPNSGGFVVLADFNHDGKLDFATSGNLLALGNGDGTFQTPAPFVPNAPTDGFNYIAAGDMNGDGWPDLVLDNYLENYIYVLLNNQHGGFSESIINVPYLTPESGPGQIALCKLTADGKIDMLTGTFYGGGAAIYLGDGQGGFTYSQTLEPALGLGVLDFALPFIFTVGDVNGDGIPDVVLSESGTLGIFLGEGNGNFESPVNYFGVGPAPGSILLENLHGQSPTAGLPDLVAPDLSGGVMVLINTTE